MYPVARSVAFLALIVGGIRLVRYVVEYRLDDDEFTSMNHRVCTDLLFTILHVLDLRFELM